MKKSKASATKQGDNDLDVEWWTLYVDDASKRKWINSGYDANKSIGA